MCVSKEYLHLVTYFRIGRIIVLNELCICNKQNKPNPKVRLVNNNKIEYEVRHSGIKTPPANASSYFSNFSFAVIRLANTFT